MADVLELAKNVSIDVLVLPERLPGQWCATGSGSWLPFSQHGHSESLGNLGITTSCSLLLTVV